MLFSNLFKRANYVNIFVNIRKKKSISLTKMYQKDFPSSIFPYEKQSTINEREELLKLNETSSIYEYAENISKLHYGYPQSITLKDGCGEPECLTQMFYSSDHLHQITSLLPWNSPNHISKGYDLYYDLNLKREADTNDIIEYYHADCKSSLAKFYPNLFLKGNFSNSFF